MRYKRFILVPIIYFVSNSTFSLGNKEFDISKIPLTQCTFEKASGKLSLMSVERSANLAKNSKITDKEMENIIIHAKKSHDPNERIVDILSPSELEKFSEANQRTQALNMAILIEGALERDYNVIRRLVIIVGEYYRSNTIPSKSNKDDYFLFGILALGQSELLELKPVKPDDVEKCNLDYALFNLQINSLSKAIELKKEWDKGIAKINEIYAKYDSNNKKFDILNEVDKNEISYLSKKYILPFQKEKNLIHSIELIRHYARFSQLRYELSMADLLYSGGDINKVDVTIEKLINNGELNKIDIWISKMWLLINEKMPSWVHKQFKIMSDNIDKMGVKK